MKSQHKPKRPYARPMTYLEEQSAESIFEGFRRQSVLLFQKVHRAFFYVHSKERRRGDLLMEKNV